jgi:hypothetical protein
MSTIATLAWKEAPSAHQQSVWQSPVATERDLWLSLMSDRRESATRLRRGASADDAILDSPLSLREKLDELRARQFRRVNAPVRRLR